MTKLNSYFDKFLENIEPSPDAKEIAQKAHQLLREEVERSNKFGDCITDTYLYGSYRRHTAIGTIKDVDIVLLTNLDHTLQENSPQSVLRRLKEGLKEFYGDPKDTAYQRRSIRVDNPMRSISNCELTLDVIPSVLVSEGRDEILIPDRELKKWILSNPKGHIVRTEYFNSENYGRGNFVPLVKMFKWWWKNWCEENIPDEERPNPKGFWLECLAGECFVPGIDTWSENFHMLLQNILNRYGNTIIVPQLNDPGLPGEHLKTSLTSEEFDRFIGAIRSSLRLMNEAILCNEDFESTILYQDIFGDVFPIFKSAKSDLTSTHKTTLGDTSHRLTLDCPIRLDPKRKHVQLYASYYNGDQFISDLVSDGPTLQPDLLLKFRAKTKIQWPYEVKWQVVNTGSHADSIEGKKGLRGGFFDSRDKTNYASESMLENWEHTAYTGKHWIQCFIIKNGACVAESDRFYVNIFNPDFQG